MSNVLIDILGMLANIVVFFFVVRFLLQAAGADFYNPMSQGVVTITDPILKPLRALVPSVGRWDFASLLGAILLQGLFTYAIYSLAGIFPGIAVQIVDALFKVLEQILTAYWLFIIINIVASFVAPGSQHPALNLLQQIIEPVMAPARKLIPPFSGLDLSPMLVFIVLIITRDSVLPQLAAATMRALGGQ